MSAQPLILQHDQWRKGLGGAPAGIAGQSDGNAYAGLDLNLITFSGSVFSGSSFSGTTFLDASWTGCQFANCTFSGCDLQRIAVSGCTFKACTFTGSRFAGCSFSGSEFTGCTWNELNFDNGRWSQLKIMACTGTHITAENLQGQQVDFTGSRFEHMQLANARIN